MMGAREWRSRRWVTVECREQVAIPLEPLFIEELCEGIRRQGWEPVEGARVDWRLIETEEEITPFSVPFWLADVSCYAIPA